MLTLEQIRWPDGPICPYCESDKAYRLTTRNGLFKCACAECRRQYTATSGTALHSRKRSSDEWMRIVDLFINRSNYSIRKISVEVYGSPNKKAVHHTISRLKGLVPMRKTGTLGETYSSDECERRMIEVLCRAMNMPATFDLMTGQPFKGPQLSGSELVRRGYEQKKEASGESTQLASEDDGASRCNP